MHFSQRGCIAPMANLAPRDLLGVRDPAAVPDLPSSVGHALSGALLVLVALGPAREPWGVLMMMAAGLAAVGGAIVLAIRSVR